MDNFIEFRNLEDLAEYLGYYYPEEIHAVAAAEGFYERDDLTGDYYLSRDGINDFLKRFGADIRVNGLYSPYILCERV